MKVEKKMMLGDGSGMLVRGFWKQPEEAEFKSERNREREEDHRKNRKKKWSLSY